MSNATCNNYSYAAVNKMLEEIKGDVHNEMLYIIASKDENSSEERILQGMMNNDGLDYIEAFQKRYPLELLVTVAVANVVDKMRGSYPYHSDWEKSFRHLRKISKREEDIKSLVASNDAEEKQRFKEGS